MSSIDDLRILLQDIVAPDLKALGARLDAIEASLKLSFESVEQRFTLLDKSLDHCFDAAEKLAAARHDSLVHRIDHSIGMANANHEAVLKALNMDRRMEQIEAFVAAQSKDASVDERTAKSA